MSKDKGYRSLKKTDYIIMALLLVVALVICLIIYRDNFLKTSTRSAKVSGTISVSDYNGKKIGVQTGTVFDQMIRINIPDAEISYYNSYTELLSALKSGSIDGFAVDEPMIKYMMAKDNSVDYIRDYMDDYSFGFAFPKSPKGEELCKEFSDYVIEAKTDGTLDSIDSLWFGAAEYKKEIPDLEVLNHDNGILTLAVEPANAPFVYLKDVSIVGYEIDLAYRFCKDNGYGLKIVDMNFDEILPAVSSGSADFGCSTITITNERKEIVDFSVPHYKGGSVLAVRAEDTAGKNNGSGETDY